MFEQSGTPAYIAPEIIRDKGYKGFKADLWSAGVVLFAMLYGTVPFKANNMKDLHLLNINPKERLSVSQTLHHPWMQGADINKLPDGEIFN